MSLPVSSNSVKGPKKVSGWSTGKTGRSSPAISAISRPQRPAQTITRSARMVPRGVTTPRMRPPSITSEVAGVLAKARSLPEATPPSTSLPATVWERGMTSPASGSHRAPWITSSSISGKRSLTSAGEIMRARVPKALPEATLRFSSFIRASSPTRATSIPPTLA